jgi:hypothetical protein
MKVKIQQGQKVRTKRITAIAAKTFIGGMKRMKATKQSFSILASCVEDFQWFQRQIDGTLIASSREQGQPVQAIEIDGQWHDISPVTVELLGTVRRKALQMGLFFAPPWGSIDSAPLGDVLAGQYVPNLNGLLHGDGFSFTPHGSAPKSFDSPIDANFFLNTLLIEQKS